jgi:hypothetical protein
MDWFQPLSEPIFLPPTIQYGAEIQPVALVPPSTVVSDGVYILVDLVNENLR